MKVLIAGLDFAMVSEIEPTINQEFLIKQSIPTGWARLAKVVRVTKSQVELEVVNVIPTQESNKFGTKNGLSNRGEGFFSDWASRKKSLIGKKFKFFKSTGIMVGDSENWNPTILAEIFNQ